jgi:hypothetical protein
LTCPHRRLREGGDSVTPALCHCFFFQLSLRLLDSRIRGNDINTGHHLWPLVLYIRLLRQVFFVSVTPKLGPHRWFFTASGRNRRQHPGLTQALTVRGRNVLNADRSATNVSRAHSAGPRPLLAEGRKRKTSDPSCFLISYAAVASKCVPSFQRRPKSTASFLATATRARLGPMVFKSFKPQLRKAEGFLT